MIGVLRDKRVICKMKGCLYRLIARPAMSYGTETQDREIKTYAAEMRMSD